MHFEEKYETRRKYHLEVLFKHKLLYLCLFSFYFHVNVLLLRMILACKRIYFLCLSFPFETCRIALQFKANMKTIKIWNRKYLLRLFVCLCLINLWELLQIFKYWQSFIDRIRHGSVDICGKYTVVIFTRGARCNQDPLTYVRARPPRPGSSRTRWVDLPLSYSETKRPWCCDFLRSVEIPYERYLVNPDPYNKHSCKLNSRRVQWNKTKSHLQNF